MAAVQLMPMTDDDFRAYRDQAVADYAAEHVRAGNWTAAEAPARAEHELSNLLPHGVATPHQYLFSILDSQTGVKVGMIWFAVNERMGRRTAFIYDFRVYEPFRRKGYGMQTLAALDERARTWGLEAIELHVFGHNPGAQALYEKAGYVVTGVQMAKKLKPAGG